MIQRLIPSVGLICKTKKIDLKKGAQKSDMKVIQIRKQNVKLTVDKVIKRSRENGRATHIKIFKIHFNYSIILKIF